MNLVVLRIHAFIMNSRGGSLDDDTNSYYNMDDTSMYQILLIEKPIHKTLPERNHTNYVFSLFPKREV